MPNAKETKETTAKSKVEADTTRKPAVEKVTANSTPAMVNKPKSKTKNAPLMILGVVIVLSIVAGGVAYLTGVFSPAEENAENTTPTEQVQDNPVIKIDGVIVGSAELAFRTDFILASMQQPGQELPAESLTQAQQIAMQQLVNETLLFNAAKAANILATKEAIQSEYDSVVGGFADEAAFKTALTERNLTKEQLRKDIEKQLTIQLYIDATIDSEKIKVTEDEVNTAYDEYSAAQDNMPALEEIYDQIEQQIAQQKLAQEVDVLLKTLQADANIEYLQ